VKRYFVAGLLLLPPQPSFAEKEPFPEQKIYMIEQPEKHHKNVIEALLATNVKFYNTVSSKLTNRVSTPADQAFCVALDYLNLCYKLVYAEEAGLNSTDENGCFGISQDLKDLRNHWTNEFLNSEGMISKKLSEHHLSENIYESIAEIRDEELRDMVFYAINEAFRHLEITEKLWKLDEKPK